jgi:TPR repeat protein
MESLVARSNNARSVLNEYEKMDNRTGFDQDIKKNQDIIFKSNQQGRYILQEIEHDRCLNQPDPPPGTGGAVRPVTVRPALSTEPLYYQGIVYEFGFDGVATDIGKAITLYGKSCGTGEAKGCLGFGKILFAGKGAIQDKPAAARYYTRSCELGLDEACFLLGAMAKNGDGILADQSAAAKLFAKACDLNWLDACTEMAIMTKSGMGGLAPDTARAMQFYTKSCSGDGNKSSAGCYNLGVLTAQGDGVPQDFGRAAALFTYACDTSYASGCFNLGLMYENGYGVKKDRNRAILLFRKASSLDPAIIKANEHLKKLGAKTCGDYATTGGSNLVKFFDAGCSKPKR